jgi:hypothetical protein
VATEEPRKVVTVVVPGRVHCGDGPLVGALGIAFLELLRADAYAFAGLDVKAPMRRGLVRILHMADAGEDDY